MAWETGAVRRLRGFRSPDTLLRTLMLHVAQGYSLRETAVRAKLAKWVDVSDVALLKRLRNGEEWLRSLCIEPFRQNGVARLEDAGTAPIRIVDGTIVREPGKTGSQWRILYSLRLPSLICDFFDVTAVIGQGHRGISEPSTCLPARANSCGCWLLLNRRDRACSAARR